MKLKRLMPLAIIILILNLIWEFCHYRLYFDLTGIPSTLHLILASFVDVGLVFLVIFLITLINKKSTWVTCPKEKDYFLFVILALILAFVWEYVNLNLSRWEYVFDMPLFFGVGLSPLLQLAITGTISLCIYMHIMNHKCKL